MARSILNFTFIFTFTFTLGHCATNRMIMGSILVGAVGNFHSHNPSDRTMALGSTQPLTNMSTRNISRKGKSSWCVGLTTLLPSCADCFEIWQPQPLGTLRACTGIALRLLFSFRLVLGDRVYRQGPLKSNTAYAPEPFGGCKGGGGKGGKGGKRQVEFQNLFQSYFTFMLYLLR